MLEASFYGLGAFGRSVGRVVCISDLIEVLSHLRLGCVESLTDLCIFTA